MNKEEARVMRAQMEATFAAAASHVDADAVIRAQALCAAWEPGVYQLGEVRTCEGVPYRCCQAHDSTANPGWTPTTERALWAPYHGTTPETALPWAAPTGAHDMYKAGECMIWTDGTVKRCRQDTNFSPTDYAQAWEDA